MLRTALLLLLLLLIGAACATTPAPTVIPTLAVLPTVTDTPTPSPTATQTPPPSHTPTATDTATPSPTATQTPLPTNTPTPSSTPTATATPLPSVTPYPTTAGDASITTTSKELVDLRGGPGFAFDPLQALSTGTRLFIVGRSWDNEWYQVRLMNGQEGWVNALYLVVWIDPSRVIVTYQEPTQPPITTIDSFALGGHIMKQSSDAYTLARRAGMTWVKVQHRFYVGQSAAEVAGMIANAHDNGFRILLGIVGDRTQMGDFDRYVAAYAAFVSDAAALGADAIEVWNEPNIDREWPAGMIHGATYTHLLAAAYTAIKSRAPGTLVISAAPAPTGFFGGDGCDTGGCNDDIFFKQMAFAGAQNYLDCVGLHHNDGIVSPLQTNGDPRGNYPTNYLSGVMGRVPPEFNSKPLCFTEVGYLSPEGYGALPGSFAWAQNTTVADQAQWLGQAVEIARASGRVELMIVWNVDFTSYTPSDPMAGYAIQRPGGSCPACDVLAVAAKR